MSERVDALLDELARRHASGEPLELAALLEAAGGESDRFAELADRLLESAPRIAPSSDSIHFVRSLADPPLLRARVAAKLRVDDVVDAIVAACAIPVELRAKARGLYQQLEGGVLDPSGVSESVWEAIAGAFGRSVAVGMWSPPPSMARYYRDRIVGVDRMSLAAAPAAPSSAVSNDMAAPAEPDLVDRLFLGE